MADIYVRSTNGNDADDGTTWALAKATVPTTIAAGDRVIVSQAHSQTQATALTITSNGTAASPVVIACGNDAAEPPTAGASTGTIATTGDSDIFFAGTNLVVEGMVVSSGTGSVNAELRMCFTGGQLQTYRNCDFLMNVTGSGAGLFIGTTGNAPPSRLIWENCDLSFGGVGQEISLISARFTWNGGSVLSGSGTPAIALFQCTSTGEGVNIQVSGVDFSNFASTLSLINLTGESGSAQFRNCKLPASWSGSLVTSGMGMGGRVEMHNCDSADTNYRLWVEDFLGTIKSETTWVRTGGASDGTTTYSWVMTSNASASNHSPLWSPEFAVWNDTVGSAITVDVEILRDSATALTNAECWLEVQYLGTSGFPLGNFVDDHVASVFATAANQTTSSETWTTTGMTNPNKQVLSVTVTPQEKGYLQARVSLAKASTTIVVDPVITLS
jgi:hypothetical protein